MMLANQGVSGQRSRQAEAAVSPTSCCPQPPSKTTLMYYIPLKRLHWWSTLLDIPTLPLLITRPPSPLLSWDYITWPPDATSSFHPPSNLSFTRSNYFLMSRHPPALSPTWQLSSNLCHFTGSMIVYQHTVLLLSSLEGYHGVRGKRSVAWRRFLLTLPRGRRQPANCHPPTLLPCHCCTL